MRNLFIVFTLSSILACSAVGETVPAAAQSRVVAIGDVHGDYAQFVRVLKSTGLLGKRNKWSGGDAVLVQVGDVPDRGPDTRKAMDLLMKLEKQARKKGGAVHALIGNHEAMNMTNDLRYVHPGEYAAFKDRQSKARRDSYYQSTIRYLTENLPEAQRPVFDDAYRQQWEQKYPLGYVEHRQGWAASGKYGKWVMSHQTVAKVGNSLFVHGGISAKYQTMPLTEINTRIRTDMANPGSITDASISEDQDGPLWYRGWTNKPETPENQALLDSILAFHGVDRMVVAHTPQMPFIIPRFAGKVVMVDVGLASHYGNGFAALEVINGKAFAHMSDSLSVPLPTEPGVEPVLQYLEQIEPAVSNSEKVQAYRELLLQPQPVPVEKELKQAAQ